VFFVEEIAGDQTNVQNVFIAQMRQGRLGITVSRRGYRESAENGDRFVVLLDGRRYEGIPGDLDFKVMDFQRYAMRVETRETQVEEASTKAMSTFGLLQAPSNAHLAELLWRIGLPIAAFVLALLAIPLSFVNPRASRSVNLLFALFTYMVYANLLSIVQAWVSQAGWLSIPGGGWCTPECLASSRCCFTGGFGWVLCSQGAEVDTLRTYMAREIYGATLFVFAAFLSLFSFFDLINELTDLGKADTGCSTRSPSSP